MKVKINRKTLLEALEKGSVAAISEEAQADLSTMSLLLKSIRVTVDKDFIIESSTNLMASKYSIPITEENEIIAEETGSVLIPAKELMTWIKAQSPDSVINMSLNKFNTPEMIKDSSNEDDAAIKQIGTIKLSSKDTSKIAAKWELDCYDSEQKKVVDYNKRGTKCFDIRSKVLIETLNKLSFAATKKDFENITDSISVQIDGNNVYFLTTDTKRCAVYKMAPSSINNVELKDTLLIPINLLTIASKISDEENDLSFFYDKEGDKIFISQKNLEIRVCSVIKETITKFPSISKLIGTTYKQLTTVAKSDMHRVLGNAMLVNGHAASFSFASNKLTLKAISEGSYKPSVVRTNVSDLAKELMLVLSPTHLMDVVKVLKSENIQIQIPENLKSVKIIGESDENFYYYSMSKRDARYESLVKDEE